MKTCCVIKEAQLIKGSQDNDTVPIYSIGILRYNPELKPVYFSCAFDGFCYSWLFPTMYQYSLSGKSLERNWLFQERGPYL